MPRENVLDRAANGVETCCNDMSAKVSQLSESADAAVKENPVTSSLVTFGVGVGIGLILTQLIPQSRRHRWYDDYLSDQRTRSVADSFMRSLPDSLTRRFGG